MHPSIYPRAHHLRLDTPRQPHLVIVDSRLETPLDARLFGAPAHGLTRKILIYTASLDGEQRSPDWLRFSPETLRFQGRAPAQSGGVYGITLRATDFDGAWAEGRIRILVK